MGDRNYKLKTRYSINQAVYDSMLRGQGFKCKICGEPHREDRKLCVDHHKLKGKDGTEGREFAAGLLCGLCNSSIAHARHDPKILQKAIDYLKNL